MTALRLKLLPWLVLLAAFGVTWLIWDHERQTAREQLRGQFDFAVHDMANRIEQRVTTYEQMLRGVQGLFEVVTIAERSALTAYVASLQPDPNFSGIQAIGVAELVPEDRKDAHIRAMRWLGFADYEILPEGRRGIYAPIIQREPNIGLNRVRPGADIWSDPGRREAMEKARDSGMPAISDKLTLFVDAGSNSPPGFIMYMPIFAQGQPHDNITQRRASLRGWIFASFRVKDIMASLYGELPQGIAVTLYDGVDLTEANVLYRPSDMGAGHPSGPMSSTEYLVVAGHAWTLSATMRDTFEARFGRSAANLIAGGGTGLSLLLSLLVWLMATGRARAVHLAESMTKDLRVAMLHTEAALEAERQAIRENRNFLAMVSHEFRTPLSIIDSAAQMLQFKNSIGNSADGNRVETIRNSVRRLVGIIDTCLADDRLDSTSGHLSLLDLDLSTLLTGLIEDIRVSIGARRINMHHEPPLGISGDPQMLVIAFSNLLDNALKFSPPDSPVEVSLTCEDGEAVIRVEDHGPGISSEDLPRIFEKFYRSTKTDRVHGAGLGLYLVKQIIDLHGGSLSVESPPGVGATFTVRLPPRKTQGHERPHPVTEGQ